MTSSEETFVPIIIRRGNFISIARAAYRDKGSYYLLRILPKYLMEGCFKTVPNKVTSWYYKFFKSPETFEFQGKLYHYLFHQYCTTWRNERDAVIPIIWDILKRYEERRKNILEVGNVLSYYFRINHDVLDKYEIMDGVINEDVVDFKPSKHYDLIVSIMTLEQVGFGENPPEATKFLRAIENLKQLLVPDGQLIVAHGLGYNNEMDKSLKNGTVHLRKQYYLKRIKDYKWQQVSSEDVINVKYDESVPTANAVMIGIIE